MFLVTFFSPNLRGRAEKNKMSKEKKKTHWLSVPDHLTDKWRTELIVLSAVIFFSLFFLFPNDDKVKQLPVATERKFEFFPVAFFVGKERFWLFSTNQHRERIRLPAPRSLAKCEALKCFRFQIKHTP